MDQKKTDDQEQTKEEFPEDEIQDQEVYWIHAAIDTSWKDFTLKVSL